MRRLALIVVVLVVLLFGAVAAGVTYYVTSGGSSRNGIVTRDVKGCREGADCNSATRSEARFACDNTHASVVEVRVNSYSIEPSPLPEYPQATFSHPSSKTYRISC